MNERKGNRRILLAAVLAFLGAATRVAAGVDVSVILVAPGPTDVPVEITLVAEPEETVAAGAERTEFSVEPGEWTLDLPAEGHWRLRAEAPGYWGNQVQVDRVSPGKPVELRLWPAGILRGTFITNGGDAMPSEAHLRFEQDARSRRAGGLPNAGLDCPVVNDIWRCEVPAGILNLTLGAGQFVPHQRWEVFLEPGQILDLGAFELVLGGSINGWVELADGGVPSEECQVRLTDTRQGKPNPTMLHAQVREDGTFVFEGIPADRYVPTASQPGYLPVTGPTVSVLPGEYAEVLKPLVLYRPATLELLFQPQAGPAGRPWRFTLTKLDPDGGKTRQIHRGQSDSVGSWVNEELAPGSYELSLTEKIGSGLFSVPIELPSGRSIVPVDLPVLLVEGYVSVGREPLAARVTLSRPKDNLTASFQSGETGSFGGLLPQEGVWEVRVHAPLEKINMSLDPIEVRAQGSSRVAVVEIRLPSTLLEGEVTDLFGNFLDRATVRIQRRGLPAGSHSVRTDSEGRFRFRGLEPGSISVMAQAGRLRSQWFYLVLEEDRSVTPLQLVVK